MVLTLATRFEDGGSAVAPPRGEGHRFHATVRDVEEHSAHLFDAQLCQFAHDVALVDEHLPGGAQLGEVAVRDAVAGLAQGAAHGLVDAVAPRRQELSVGVAGLQFDDDEGLAGGIVGEHVRGGRHVGRHARDAALREDRRQIQALERVEHDFGQCVHPLRRASVDRARDLPIDGRSSAAPPLLSLPERAARVAFARLGGQQALGEDVELQALRQAAQRLVGELLVAEEAKAAKLARARQTHRGRSPQQRA